MPLLLSHSICFACHTGPQVFCSQLTIASMTLQAQWVVDGSRTRCIVLAEGDPCSSTLGRVSFKGFNPETERLQQEAEQREARRAAAAATDLEGKSVSDEAMAAQ